jgi:hypothetical protein
MIKKREEKAYAFIASCIELFLLNLVWMGLKLIIYGEVQHRIVDDIIGILILYKFYKGNKRSISIKKGILKRE